MLHRAFVGHIKTHPFAALQPGGKVQAAEVVQLCLFAVLKNLLHPRSAGLLALLAQGVLVVVVLVGEAIQQDQRAVEMLRDRIDQGLHKPHLIAQLPPSWPPHA